MQNKLYFPAGQHNTHIRAKSGAKSFINTRSAINNGSQRQQQLRRK